MAIAKSSIGSQRQRQFAGPLDPDIVFETKASMTAYLQRAISYAGMIATCLEEEGSLFVLNNAKTAWLEVGSNGETFTDYSYTRNDIVANVAVGGIAKGTVIPKGTRLETFLTNHLFKKIPEPVKESRTTQPSFSLGNTAYRPYIGDTITYTVTFKNVSRGSVIGDYDSGNWEINTVRGDWAGLPLEYRIDDEVITQSGGVYSKTFTDVVVTSTPIKHTCEIDFDDGSTARINSEGTTLDTYSAGTIYRDTVISGTVKPVPEPEDTEDDEEIDEVPVAYPTFTEPSMGVSQVKSYQSDGTLNVTLTVTSSTAQLRAYIKGDIVDGVWSDTANQDYRLGSIVGFSNGTTAEGAGTATTWGDSSVKSQTINVANENQTIYVAMQYGEGVQPVDSSGANYGDPEPAGYITTAVSVTRVSPPVLYYAGVLSSVGSISASSVASLGSKSLPSSSKFNLIIPSGTQAGQIPIIAYPTSRASSPNVVDNFNMPISLTSYGTLTIGGVSCYVFYYGQLAIDLPVQVTWTVTI